VNVFPAAFVVTEPQPRVEGRTRGRLVADRIKMLYGADVSDAGGACFVVQDVDARIHHVDVGVTRRTTADVRLAESSARAGTVVKVKSLERFALSALCTVTPFDHVLVISH